MAHKITKLDRIVSLQPCWHKLEQIVPEITFDNSGLNWNVVKAPVTVNGELAGDWQAVVREDTNLILNIPKKSYEIIQNSRVWEMIDNALNGVDYHIQVAGSLQGCRKIFISISLDDKQDYCVNADKYKNFLTFATSHDGSMALEAYDTSVRVVCNNTLIASRADKGDINLKVMHTSNANFKIEDMEQTLERLFNKRDEFYSSLKFLAHKPMSADYANKILLGFVSSDAISTRAENVVSKIITLFKSGKGNHGKTYYDLLNGVTEFYTHHATENKEKALVSNEFGVAGERKVEFYDALLSDAALDNLAKRGEQLLKKQKSAVLVD